MTVQRLRSNNYVQVPATVVVVGLMVLFPYLVHLIGGPTAGARWLPVFYAPFAALILFSPWVAVAGALIAPFLNHLLLGAPPLPMAAMLSFELVLFSVVSYQFYQRRPAFWGIAPLAFVLSKVGSALLLALLPVNLLPVAPWQYFTTSLQNGLPGMLVLLLINWLVVQGVQRDG